MSNYQSSFHVIDLKLDIEPSLTTAANEATALLELRSAMLHAIGGA